MATQQKHINPQQRKIKCEIQVTYQQRYLTSEKDSVAETLTDNQHPNLSDQSA